MAGAAYTGYVVQPGDTYWKIAQAHGVSLRDLLAANHASSSELYPGQLISMPRTQGAYGVVRGDTMWSIAQKLGVTLTALIAANPQIDSPSAIYVGQSLFVPQVDCAAPVSSRYIGYVVKPGDSFWKIAQAHNVSLRDLLAANHSPDEMHPGNVISVPVTEGTYRVIRGDTMWSIAQKLGVTPTALIAANPQIDSPASIYVGQSLHLPTAGCR